MGFPCGSVDKEPVCKDARNIRLIPGSGRSPGGGHGFLLGEAIQWTEEAEGLQSVGCKELDTTEVTEYSTKLVTRRERPIKS